jgi:hypothetical protein
MFIVGFLHHRFPPAPLPYAADADDAILLLSRPMAFSTWDHCALSIFQSSADGPAAAAEAEVPFTSAPPSPPAL